MIRVYTICKYCDQKKQHVRATKCAFTVVRESSMVRAYIIRIYSDKGRQYGQFLHNLQLL